MKNRILSCMVIFVILASCQENAKEVETQAKAEIRFDSHPVAESHRTVIAEKYKAGEANFASHYVIVTWGCGSGCVTGAMVDTRDGFVYPMPEDKEWGGNGTYIDSKKESPVLLTVVVAQSPTGEIEESRKYWEWSEDSKTFKFVNEESVVMKSSE